jgi:hypothetical protein
VGSLSFLTPLAAVVALVGLLPLAVFLRRERRSRAVRRALQLREPPTKLRTWLVAAIAMASALTGIAAAQPVLDRSEPQPERSDAEIFFALDTSRSMLAAPASDAPTRFERAHAAAVAIRSQLPEVPAGIAQFTDWTVPHLFPTVDASTFRHVLERSVYIESLGSREDSILATDLNALAAFAGDSYFSPGVAKRLVIVLTDGESRPLGSPLAVLSRSGIRTIFVHVWGSDESVWRPKGAEPQYRPDPASRATLAQAARLVDGVALGERDVGAVVERARVELDAGPTRPGEHGDLLALMPYVMLAAALPLGFLLRHRNL